MKFRENIGLGIHLGCKIIKISMKASINLTKVTQGTNSFSHGSLTTKIFTSPFSFLYVQSRLFF